MLASATFDMDGRIMVTPEGSLPNRKITDSYAERSFDEVFTVDHPVFCWIFKASRCWASIASHLPAIRSHIQTTILPEGISSSSINPDEDYSTTFMELFCVAANDLATLTQTSFENIGVLFGGIISTGTLNKNASWKRLQRLWKPNSLESIEKGQFAIYGRGQVLFVVRRVDRFESIRLQATGHRFATISNVIDFLARSMEVTRDGLLPHLERMRDNSEVGHCLISFSPL